MLRWGCSVLGDSAPSDRFTLIPLWEGKSDGTMRNALRASRSVRAVCHLIVMPVGSA